jgi:two-component system, sensor histidine kinase and response regulator
MVPASAPEPSPAGLPIKPPSESTILVVDDDDRIVEIFAVMLRRDGYRVESATDGFAGMKMIEEVRPDIAILDVILPGLDGIEMCRRIKNNPETRFLPVILVTGMSARVRRLEGLAAGADDFLEKPPDPVELTVRVRSLLRTKQLYDEVEAHRRELEERVAERTQELREAYERLQALSRVKSNVLMIVSHELRTPLNQVKIALALAHQEDLPEHQKAVVLQEALDSLNLLEYRVADIEAFSDPTDVRLAPWSTRDLINAAVEQVRSLRRGHTDQIEIEIPKGLPPILVSPASVTRALAHLILNGVKFGEGKPIKVCAELKADGVQLDIRDQGHGINEELVPRLFEPLEQGDVSTTRRQSGLGIGLALVKVILDAHHIDLNIDSQEDAGTTVSLLIPIATIDNLP